MSGIGSTGLSLKSWEGLVDDKNKPLTKEEYSAMLEARKMSEKERSVKAQVDDFDQAVAASLQAASAKLTEREIQYLQGMGLDPTVGSVENLRKFIVSNRSQTLVASLQAAEEMSAKSRTRDGGASSAAAAEAASAKLTEREIQYLTGMGVDLKSPSVADLSVAALREFMAPYKAQARAGVVLGRGFDQAFTSEHLGGAAAARPHAPPAPQYDGGGGGGGGGKLSVAVGSSAPSNGGRAAAGAAVGVGGGAGAPLTDNFKYVQNETVDGVRRYMQWTVEKYRVHSYEVWIIRATRIEGDNSVTRDKDLESSYWRTNVAGYQIAPGTPEAEGTNPNNWRGTLLPIPKKVIEWLKAKGAIV